jgi:EAL domain-containing protein (putative c-di-GMP-specific phosphodiesterase class I)
MPKGCCSKAAALPFRIKHHAGSGHAHVDLDPERLKLLQGIVSLARALGKRTIAEGAERSAEVAVLASLECDPVQGFVSSRPLVAAEAMIRASELEEAALRQITEAA